MRALLVTAALTSVALCAAAPARAARSIPADPLHGQKVRIDGVFKEYPGTMTALSETVRGNAGGGDPRASGQIGYDDKYLYVALRVLDGKLVRTRAAGKGEDHATLLIAFPEGRGYTTHEVLLYPGDPGKLPGVVKLGGTPVRGAKLVEAPEDKGFTIEAQIPWSTFPQARTTRVGLRAALRYADADKAGSVKAVVATSGAAAGRRLPPLPLEAEQGLFATLVRQRNLSGEPSHASYGNVSGDGTIERVAIYGGFLTIVGSSYRGGKEFYFSELGVRSPKMVRGLSLRDVDGDGHDDIVVRKRVGDTDQYRELLDVLKVGENGQPFSVFVHEIGIKTPDGFVDNDVDWKRRGAGWSVTIAQGKEKGFDPGTYAESRPNNMGSALMPWESVKSRTFAWQSDRLEKVDEQTWTPKVAATSQGSPSRPKRRADAPAPPAAPPAPRPPSSDELQDRLYALYRYERGVGAR
jgi:hypothetical protein